MNIVKNIVCGAAERLSGQSQGPQEFFNVTIERAEGVRKSDWFSKSDAYVKIDFGGKSHRTKTIKNDVTPVFRESFKFNVRGSNADRMEIRLMDHDTFTPDDTIGTATIGRTEFPSNGQSKDYKVNLYKKSGEVIGCVYLSIRYENFNSNSSTNSQSNTNYSANNNYPGNSTNYQSQPPISSTPQYQPSYNNNPQYPSNNSQYPSNNSQYPSNNPHSQQYPSNNNYGGPQGLYNPPNSNYGPSQGQYSSNNYNQQPSQNYPH